MRTKTLAFTFITIAIPLIAQSQTANSGGAAAGGAVTPATGASTANRANSQIVQPGTRVQPGTIRRDQSQLPMVGGVATNRFGLNTNQFLAQTNQFPGQTNQLVILTNQFLTQSNSFSSASNLPPVRTGWTQTSGVAPNIVVGTNIPATLLQDRAVNQNDRTVLVQIHRNLRGVFTAPASLASVHFLVQNGVVTAFGTVQTMEQRQRLLQMVQATPNVTQVIDQLNVNPSPGAPISTTGFAFRTNQFGIQTLSPTGLTPSEIGTNTNLNRPQVPTNPIPPISNP